MTDEHNANYRACRRALSKRLTPSDLAWLPGVLREPVSVLFAAGQRIPQESLGTRALAEHVLEKRPANHAGRHSGRGWGLNHLWRGELADLEVVAQSWFEDGPDIVQVIAGARGRNCAGRASILPPLHLMVEPRHRCGRRRLRPAP